jgi:hypothetical protein
MRGADGGRRYAVPFRSPPARGQVGEDSIEPARGKEPWDVLHEEEAGSNLANDTPDLVPEPPLVGDASSLPGERVRLAREAGANDVHPTGKRPTVEGSEVKPDWSRRQRPVLHASRQDFDGTGIPLDVTDSGCCGHGEPDAELESAGAGAEGEDAHVMPAARAGR